MIKSKPRRFILLHERIPDRFGLQQVGFPLRIPYEEGGLGYFKESEYAAQNDLIKFRGALAKENFLTQTRQLFLALK